MSSKSTPSSLSNATNDTREASTYEGTAYKSTPKKRNVVPLRPLQERLQRLSARTDAKNLKEMRLARPTLAVTRAS